MVHNLLILFTSVRRAITHATDRRVKMYAGVISVMVVLKQVPAVIMYVFLFSNLLDDCLYAVHCLWLIQMSTSANRRPMAKSLLMRREDKFISMSLSTTKEK